jgi:hypothetical protein
MNVLRSLSILLIAAGMLGASQEEGNAQEVNVIDREYEIKAVYLWHFARYVEWPESKAKEKEFVIGVLGKDLLEPYLGRIAASKTVGDKKIVVRRFDTAEDYKPSQILFISSAPAKGRNETAEERLKAALAKTKGSPVLIVSDTPGLARKGAAISFLIDRQENRIKLEINPEAAKRAGLKISSRLLALQDSGVVKLVEDDKKQDQ